MLLEKTRECSTGRLTNELDAGRSLRDRAIGASDIGFESELDAECRDWCESVAFATNFAFNGEAQAFLSTLGHYPTGHHMDGFQDWVPPWSTPSERVQVLTLYLELLQSRLERLEEKFQDEDEAVRAILGAVRDAGGRMTPFAVQLFCRLETPEFDWLVKHLKSEGLINLDEDGAACLTPSGIAFLNRPAASGTPNPDGEATTPKSDPGLWINTWVGIAGIVITLTGIVVSIAQFL
jgi:hypothetical protein